MGLGISHIKDLLWSEGLAFPGVAAHSGPHMGGSLNLRPVQGAGLGFRVLFVVYRL